jgi:hypothetical protein
MKFKGGVEWKAFKRTRIRTTFALEVEASSTNPEPKILRPASQQNLISLGTTPISNQGSRFKPRWAAVSYSALLGRNSRNHLTMTWTLDEFPLGGWATHDGCTLERSDHPPLAFNPEPSYIIHRCYLPLRATYHIIRELLENDKSKHLLLHGKTPSLS